MHHHQGDRLGQPVSTILLLGQELQPLPPQDPFPRLTAPAIHGELAAFQPALETSAGKVGPKLCDCLINAPTKRLRGQYGVAL